MVTPGTPPTRSMIPEPSDLPLENEQVTRQLSRLFGESLFGPWPQLGNPVERGLRRGRRARKWLSRFAILCGLGAVSWGGYRLFQPGLENQENSLREQYAAELRSFLKEGDLERVGQYLPLVAGAEVTGKLTEAYSKSRDIDLLVSAEAALYRYFDADPARIVRIRPLLDGKLGDFTWRRVAAMTLLSREERAARLSELERIIHDSPNHQELEYLRASALSFRGDLRDASDAWRRSAKLGPAWLVHRFEQAQFEQAQGDDAAAKKLALHMLRTDPDNAWAKLGQVTFGVELPANAVSVRGDARAPVVPPVQRFVELLLQTKALAKQGNAAGASAQLLEAFSQVHFQPPFLLDAFDELFDAKLWGLLGELTSLPQWPKASAVAEAKVKRLARASKAGQAP